MKAVTTLPTAAPAPVVNGRQHGPYRKSGNVVSMRLVKRARRLEAGRVAHESLRAIMAAQQCAESPTAAMLDELEGQVLLMQVRLQQLRAVMPQKAGTP